MDKSDFMLWTNISDLQFKDKRTNDLAYLYQMTRSPVCAIDRTLESHLLLDHYRSKTPACVTNYCGHPEPIDPCPGFDRYNLAEFLIVPCIKPTHKNYVICGEDKCCTKQHQLFKNLTKRRNQ